MSTAEATPPVTGARHDAARPRVVVVDVQTLFRSGLVELLGNDGRLEVVGSAAGGPEAVELCRRLEPAVALLDTKLPGSGGPDTIRAILEASPTTRVLVLTEVESDDSVLSSLRAGASGYVLKDAQPEAIVSSIVAVSLGEHVLSSSVGRRLLELALPRVTPPGGHGTLTRREVEILRLIAKGEPNRVIADKLAISDKTVRNHVSHLYEKLAVSNRSEAVLCALREGLVEL